MTEISDELLMAFADLELDSIEHTRLQELIMHDPELRTRLQAFQSSRDVLGGLFDQPMREPVPEHLVKLVMGAPTRAAVALSPSRRAWHDFTSWLQAQLTFPNAVAATAVLVVGASAGWMARDANNLSRSNDQLVALSDGKIVAHGALQRVLEASPSGQVHRAVGGKNFSSLKVLATFKAAANGPAATHGFCREYELIVQTGQRHTGIGCRDGGGRWTVEAYAPAPNKPTAAGGVVPAGAPKSDVVDAAIERMIVGDMFQADQEARVIAHGWLGE
ncbi:MAG: hypothetical protein ABL898_10220 [Hyphomicrobiaceae bacterium]|nr:hypothetical protein [Hyphomicrobiaceae bacterium]